MAVSARNAMSLKLRRAALYSLHRFAVDSLPRIACPVGIAVLGSGRIVLGTAVISTAPCESVSALGPNGGAAHSGVAPIGGIRKRAGG